MEEESWRRNLGRVIMEASGRHLETARSLPEAPRRHPEGTQEAPRRHPRSTQEAPRRHPGNTQEAPRRHQGTRRHPGSTQEAPRKHPGSTQEAPRRHPPEVFPPSPGDVWGPILYETSHKYTFGYQLLYIFYSKMKPEASKNSPWDDPGAPPTLNAKKQQKNHFWRVPK